MRALGIGARVRIARERANLTQADIGALFGRDQQWTHKVESGRIKRLSEEVILKIAQRTQCSPAWLALGIEELDKASDEAMTVAVHYDHLPMEIRNKILSLIAQYQRPEPRKPVAE